MTNKRITRTLAILSVVFLSLIVYMTVFDALHHDDYAQSYADERKNYVRRGKIYDRYGEDGELLAESIGELHEQERVYPHTNLYCHIIGHDGSTHEQQYIEKYYHNELMGTSSQAVLGDIMTIFSDARYMFKNKKEEQTGADITLTIDHELQQYTREIFKNTAYNNFSAVAMDPTTGEILAMVSVPEYDPTPAVYQENAEKLEKSDGNPILAHAYRDFVYPGSVAKIITTCALIEEGYEDHIVDETKKKNQKVSNYDNDAGIKDRTLESAFINSSNVYFSEAVTLLSQDTYMEYAEKFMYNTEYSLDELPVVASKMSPDSSLANLTLGGNGNQTTPLHMALIASTIANDGDMVKPHIIKEISGATGYKTRTEYLKTNCIEERTADIVEDYMYQVVNKGTGQSAKVSGVKVCGKTGSADGGGAAFVGFAPKDNPKIAVCVYIRDTHKTGGSAAAPLAGQIIAKYLNK